MSGGLGDAGAALLLHPLSVEGSRAAIEALPAATRAAMAAHWRRRARSERRIGRGFARIAPRLRDVGVAAGVVALCEGAAEEEARHADLCGALAGLYDAAAAAPEPVPDDALPAFGSGDPRIEAALLIVGTCCINETLATAYIAACLEAATVPCAVEANRVHLREEIGHGRIGWALLASNWVDAGLRAELSAWLPDMLAANLPLWLRADPWLPQDGVPGFGHPSRAAIGAAIERALAEVVVPGFAYVGLEVAGLDVAGLVRASR